MKLPSGPTQAEELLIEAIADHAHDGHISDSTIEAANAYMGESWCCPLCLHEHQSYRGCEKCGRWPATRTRRNGGSKRHNAGASHERR